MARREYEREQAEKACSHAEELFLAGNVREASRAKRLCPSLPGVANAVAAYEVLGVRPGEGAATQDAIKRQYKRLSLLVHPDKARCAAAFKLVRDACEKALAFASGAGDTISPPPRAASSGRHAAGRRDARLHSGTASKHNWPKRKASWPSKYRNFNL
nr:unnamed protein product [Digitaria exilis]